MRSQFRSLVIMALVALAMGACDGGSSPPAPTVKLTSSVSGVVDPGTLVTLSWSTTHATSCLASGAWSHPQGIDGGEGVVVLRTSTYTLSCSGPGGVATSSVTITVSGPPSTHSAALEEMLWALPGRIEYYLPYNQNLLPGNPQSAPYIQAKITMLQNPDLVAEINNGQYWVEGSAASRLPFVALFPTGNMRVEATQAMQSLERALPVLEDFMGTPLYATKVGLWYGFVISSFAGVGMLDMEDQSTYEARTGTGRLLPYEAILYHELSHSFMGNESLDQFLELYVYNMLHTNSQDLQVWIFTRNYVAWDPSNTGVHALLDVYQLIGPSAMARAYRTVYPFHPPCGAPLPASSKQAFIDQAPSALTAQVADKMAMVTY
jgi:hypothetical protein